MSLRHRLRRSPSADLGTDAARTLHECRLFNDINEQHRIFNPMLMLAEGATLLSGTQPGAGQGKNFLATKNYF